MKKDIEVEIRGPLTKEGFLKLKEVLDRKGKFIREKERLSLLYFRDKIPEDVNEIKDDPIDLRVRITNKKAELMLKSGYWGGSDTRKEISIPFELSNFESIIQFLKILNWHICVVYSTRAYIYEYQGIEFSLVDVRNFGYNYEAEILAASEQDVPSAKKKILQICRMLKLSGYKPGEFENQCNKMNHVKEQQFDFNKDDPLLIRRKFKDSF